MHKPSTGDLGAGSHHNFPIAIATMAASARQRKFSIGAFVLLVATIAVAMPFANIQLAHVDAFVPIAQTVIWGVGLDALVRNQLAPYATGRDVTISGTDVMLTSAGIQAVARVLHELATNAAKYGALSIPNGQVSVNWDRKPDGNATT
jgi:hypothetical protein